MILSEFKAWFEGFTEGLEAAPTKAQFDRIKAKVADITGTPLTQTVYVDRYVRDIPYSYYPPYYVRPYGAWGGISSAVSGTLNLVNGGIAQNAGAYGSSNAFDSHSAMHALGKAEAAIN